MTDELRCPPHNFCEPGCWETARGPKGERWFPHCWKCGEHMRRVRVQFHWREVEERFGIARSEGCFSLCVLGSVLEFWW